VIYFVAQGVYRQKLVQGEIMSIRVCVLAACCSVSAQAWAADGNLLRNGDFSEVGRSFQVYRNIGSYTDSQPLYWNGSAPSSYDSMGTTPMFRPDTDYFNGMYQSGGHAVLSGRSSLSQTFTVPDGQAQPLQVYWNMPSWTGYRHMEVSLDGRSLAYSTQTHDDVTTQSTTLNLAAGNHTIQFAITADPSQIRFGASNQYTGWSNYYKVVLDSAYVGIGAVPEPATVALMGLGLVGLAAASQRRRQPA
jgi:PEP-CTERM motif